MSLESSPQSPDPTHPFSPSPRRIDAEPEDELASIIALERFILATRDSGYKGTAAAVAELVDNALQAGARRVHVEIDEEPGPLPLRVRVQDDGAGMDAATLREALRFGGSSRFDDRGGLGRYGMGLPNSSLSQARRLEVYSWRRGPMLAAWLDLDEIAAGRQRAVPTPRPAALSPPLPGGNTSSGTLVVWRRCDRLDLRRPSALARRLREHLGRVFRTFLWDGLQLRVNGEPVEAFDPLYLDPRAPWSGARPFGAPLRYPVDCPLPDGRRAQGEITVTFSELPVVAWHGLSNEEKRRMGVSKGAGVSVVRAGREIDHGWLFMGDKRKENYDDWWRCEVRFEPGLDELFGVTHTKQQVHPSEALLEILSPDLEQAARALNARARRAHEQLQLRRVFAPAERHARRCEPRLPPLPAPTAEDRAAAASMSERHALPPAAAAHEPIAYTLLLEPAAGTELFTLARDEGRLIAAMNAAHPLVQQVYAGAGQDPALEPGAAGPLGQASLDAVILAMARAELAAPPEHRPALAAFRRRWSDVLAEFLKESANAS